MATWSTFCTEGLHPRPLMDPLDWYTASDPTARCSPRSALEQKSATCEELRQLLTLPNGKVEQGLAQLDAASFALVARSVRTALASADADEWDRETNYATGDQFWRHKRTGETKWVTGAFLSRLDSAAEPKTDMPRARQLEVRPVGAPLSAPAQLLSPRGSPLSPRTRRVRLNVGGCCFETTLATLTRFPRSTLAALFADADRSAALPVDDDGRVFIDRNGAVFDVILEFLRTDVASVADLSSRELRLLRAELSYYELQADFDAALKAGSGGGATIAATDDLVAKPAAEQTAKRSLRFVSPW